MKVVVTGGAGFIGANLCRSLCDQPSIDEVVALDDLSTGSASNLDGVDVELVEGSILDEHLVARAMHGADAVVHLAARPSVPRSIIDPATTHELNATGTLRVLDAARALDDPLVIVASSSSVYGANPRLPKSEDMTPMPISPYAVSKLAGEQYAIAYAHCYGLRVLPFRFFNVFGPLQPVDHDYAAVVPAFVSAALEGRPIPVYGDGNQSRDFTYVGTVSATIVAAIDQQVSSPSPLNLAFGSRVSLLGLIERLEAQLGHALEVDFQAPRPGDVLHSQADSSRLLAAFPALVAVPLDEGLEATIAWMRSQAAADPRVPLT